MAIAIYKAKESYKKAKNNLKETQMHTHNTLLKGGEVVLPANLEGLPETLKQHLVEVVPQVEEKEVKEVVKKEKSKESKGEK